MSDGMEGPLVEGGVSGRESRAGNRGRLAGKGRLLGEDERGADSRFLEFFVRTSDKIEVATCLALIFLLPL